MQPSRTALALLLLAAGIVSGQAADKPLQVDPSKVSEFQGKAFNLKEAPGFGGSAPGFDKAAAGYGSGTSPGWVDRRADVGGRDIYSPDLKMDQAFAVPQTGLFQGASPFSDKTAPFSMTDSKLPMNAPLDHFGTQVPFSGKAYAGPENDRLRAALGQLLDKNQGAIAAPDPLHPTKNDALHKQMNSVGGHVGPIITVDDIRGLINKDVSPVSPAAAPEAAAPMPAQGVTVK